jgi:predicted glycoside hydrolase/deacetylase ChbG (UPF0249 family)
VNQSVVDLARHGALSSTTLMATGSAFEDAVRAAQASPNLGVGCHVVLVGGHPAAPLEHIGSLVGKDGNFRRKLGKFVRDLMLGGIREEEIEAEACAQIQRLQQAGIRVTHVDTHKHTHMFPAVLRPLLRAAARCGIGVVRNPFEPDWALAATSGAPALRRLEVRMLRSWRGTFYGLVRQAGFATTDGAIGVLATGTLDARILKSLLGAMPDGVWELVCHPGYNDAALAASGTRLRESRVVEHDALLEAIPKLDGIERIHFGALSSK